MSLRCSMPALIPASDSEVWTERTGSTITERLSQISQMRRRTKEEELSMPAVEVVHVHPAAVTATAATTTVAAVTTTTTTTGEVAAACANAAGGGAGARRGEARRRYHLRLPQVLLVLLLCITCVTAVVYLAEHHSPLESAAMRTLRRQAAERRAEEAAYSKLLWAEVLRRRLQEQAAVGQAQRREFDEGVAMRGRIGVLAAGLAESDEEVETPTAAMQKGTAEEANTAPTAHVAPRQSATAEAATAQSANTLLRVPPRGVAQEPHPNL